MDAESQERPAREIQEETGLSVESGPLLEVVTGYKWACASLLLEDASVKIFAKGTRHRWSDDPLKVPSAGPPLAEGA